MQMSDTSFVNRSRLREGHNTHYLWHSLDHGCPAQFAVRWMICSAVLFSFIVLQEQEPSRLLSGTVLASRNGHGGQFIQASDPCVNHSGLGAKIYNMSNTDRIMGNVSSNSRPLPPDWSSWPEQNRIAVLLQWTKKKGKYGGRASYVK